MGCAVEKPFLQILCFLKGMWTTNGLWHFMYSASEPSICKSHLLSMVKGLFELGMLDPTPVIGDAGVLRRLVVQIQRSEFKFGNNNFSGRAAYTFVRGSTNSLNQLFLKDFWLEIAPCAPGKLTKTPSPFHHKAPHSVTSSRVSVQWIPLFLFHVHYDSHPFACLYDAQVKRIIVQSMKSPQYPRWALCCCFSLVASAHPLTIFIPFSFPTR